MDANIDASVNNAKVGEGKTFLHVTFSCRIKFSAASACLSAVTHSLASSTSSFLINNFFPSHRLLSHRQSHSLGLLGISYLQLS
jgi:hypothetical protein